MFKRFPISGVGIGNFIEYRMKYVDGVRLNPHNLAGELLGETGLLGAITFVFFVTTIFARCRRIRICLRQRDGPTAKILSKLSLAIRDSTLLLLFTGLFGHNLLRFNWLWLAAFGTLALQFVLSQVRETPP